MKRYLFFLALFLYNPIFSMHEDDTKSEIIKEDSTVKTSSFKNNALRFGKFAGQIALAAGISYCGAFATAIVHELGHGVVAKLLLGCPLKIDLGGYTSNYITKAGIHVVGFDPDIGTTSYPTGSSPLQEIAIRFAGPMAGIICVALQNYILKKQNSLPKLTSQLCLDYNTSNFIVQLHNLVPYSNRSDGGKIAELLNLIKYDHYFDYGEIFNPTPFFIFNLISVLTLRKTFHLFAPIKLLYTCYKHYPK